MPTKQVVSKCWILLLNFDLLGRLGLDERWKEMDRMEEEEKKKRDADIKKRETLKSWESQDAKRGPLNRRCGQFAVFRPGVRRKIWLLILNQSPKWS